MHPKNISMQRKRSNSQRHGCLNIVNVLMYIRDKTIKREKSRGYAGNFIISDGKHTKWNGYIMDTNNQKTMVPLTALRAWRAGTYVPLTSLPFRIALGPPPHPTPPPSDTSFFMFFYLFIFRGHSPIDLHGHSPASCMSSCFRCLSVDDDECMSIKTDLMYGYSTRFGEM